MLGPHIVRGSAWRMLLPGLHVTELVYNAHMLHSMLVSNVQL